MTDKFPCSGCGACCHRIDKAVKFVNEHIDETIEFPHGWDNNGKCGMLGDDNKCKIYEDRPDICNVDKMYKYFNLSKEEYYNSNSKACNGMIKEDGLPDSYLIPLPETN